MAAQSKLAVNRGPLGVALADAARALCRFGAGDSLYRDIINHAPDAMLAFLPDGRIAVCNTAAERLFGVRATSVLGEPFTALVGAEDITAAITRLLAGGPDEELESSLTGSDGRSARLLVTLSALRDGGVLRALICHARDVTDRVEAVATLESASRVLERELEERAGQLAQLGMQLDAAIRNRDAFMSMASHELRSPLNTLSLQVQGMLRLSRRADATALPLQQRLEAMGRQVVRLSTLVDRLLDFSLITAGRVQLELEEVDLSALVHDIVERHADEAERAGCAVDLDVEAGVRGSWDHMRLEQILINLLSNALKFGAGQPVRITLGRQGGAARLAVRDQGIGISKEEVGRLFERFERLVSDRHFAGFGLGLWIVRQIVEALGGRIEIDSEPGRGATFIVVLPIDAALLPAGPQVR